MSERPVPQTNSEVLRLAIWNALPGTTKEIADRIGVSATTVRRYLRPLITEGKVEQRTRHFSSLAYTFVYQRAERADDA